MLSTIFRTCSALCLSISKTDDDDNWNAIYIRIHLTQSNQLRATFVFRTDGFFLHKCGRSCLPISAPKRRLQRLSMRRNKIAIPYRNEMRLLYSFAMRSSSLITCTDSVLALALVSESTHSVVNQEAESAIRISSMKRRCDTNCNGINKNGHIIHTERCSGSRAWEGHTKEVHQLNPPI